MDNTESESTKDNEDGTANDAQLAPVPTGIGGGEVTQTPTLRLDPDLLQSLQSLLPMLQQAISPTSPGQHVTLANKINVTVTDSLIKAPRISPALKLKLKAAKSIFVKNRGYDFALGTLEDQGHVVIAGSPGSGKSTMALYLMHKFDDMNYKLKFVRQIRDFNPDNDIDPHHPSLVVFDDVFHHTHTSLDYQSAFEDFEEYFRAVENRRIAIFSKSNETKDESSAGEKIEFPLKVVFTTRTSSFREVSPQISRFKNLFKPSSVVDLTTSAKLNRDEKRDILIKHLEQHDMQLTEEEIDMIANEEYSTLGFPYICRLFVENIKRWKSAVEFFKKPLAYLNECIKSFFYSTESKHTAAALLLILLYDGGLDLSRITDVSNYKPGDVELLYSRLTEVIPGLMKHDFLVEIKRVAINQVNTFLINEGDVVKFSHPTIHDAVAFVVGSKDPTFVLRNCSLTFIIERMRVARQSDKQLSSGNEYDYTIDLQKQSVMVLVERLAIEVAEGNFALALFHKCLREHDYANHLLRKISAKCPLKDVFHRTDGIYGLCLLFWAALTCNNVLFNLILKDHFESQEVAEASLGCCMSGNLEGIKMLLEQYRSDISIFEKIKSISLRDILPKHEQTKHTYHALKSFYGSSTKSVNQFDIEATRMHGENRDKLIHIAAANGHSEIVTILLETGVNIDTKGGTGMTALMYACYHGYKECAENLIAKGANTDLLDDEEDNCLHLASRAGFKGLADILLKSGMDINRRGYHWRTPLMFASQYEKYDVVKLLLEKGAETEPDTSLVSLKDTCLHLAAGNGHTAIVKELIELGKMHIETTGERNRTALMCACRHGHLETAQYLAKKADMLAVDVHMFTCLHLAAIGGHSEILKWLLSSNKFDINVCNAFMRTPLMYTMLHGHYEAVQILMKSGADTRGRDKRGNTCLHFAARSGLEILVEKCIDVGLDIAKCNEDGDTSFLTACSQGCLDVVVNLHINHSDSININQHGFRGRTPLLQACYFGNREIVEYLINSGANYKQADDVGQSCTHLACYSGKIEIIHVLQKHNIFDIKAVDNEGMTPFLLAAKSDRTEVIDYLIDMDPRVKDATDNRGNSALHMACWNGSLASVQKLLQIGVSQNVVKYHSNSININQHGFRGRTPLLQACYFGNREIVEYLINSGANYKQADDVGQSCTHLACYSGKIEIVHVLQKHNIFDIKAVDNEGMTPFLLAAKSDRTEVIDYLIDMDPRVKDATDNRGSSALHMACWNGSLASVQKLLQIGVSLSLCNKSGDTCFHFACSSGHVGIVEYLHLQNNDKIDVNQPGFCRQSPLYMASSFGRKNVVKYLVEVAGADHKLTDDKDRTCLSVACYRGHTEVVRILHDHDTSAFDENAVNLFFAAVRFDRVHVIEYLLQMRPCLKSKIFERGQNALHIACFYGAVKSVAKVIEAGTDVNAQDNHLMTPLMLAVRNQSSKVDIVTALVQKNADVMLSDRNGSTCLHSAVRALGHTSMTEALLNMGLDVNIRDYHGETAIMLACRNNAKDYFKLLLRKGADVNLVNSKGESALHLGCMSSEDDSNMITQLLQRDNKNVNRPDKFGKTPTMYAVSNGKEQTLQLLIRSNADPTKRDFRGFSTLHTACARSPASTNINIINMLIAHGVHVNSRNQYGQTPLMLAAACGNDYAIKVLLTKRANLILVDDHDRNCIYYAERSGYLQIAEKLYETMLTRHPRYRTGKD